MSRYRNQQLTEMLPGNADVSRYRNQNFFDLPSANADVSRYRNQILSDLPPGNADISRYRNQQMFDLPPGDADVTRYRNLAFIDMDESDEANLKVLIWGPSRASPGQTIDYVIEHRNDGLMSAKNMTVIFVPPFLTEFVSASPQFAYDDVIHMMRYDLLNVFPKSSGYLTVRVRLLWGLPLGTTLDAEVYILPKEFADLAFEHDSPELDRNARENAEKVWKATTYGTSEPLEAVLEASISPLVCRAKVMLMDGLYWLSWKTCMLAHVDAETFSSTLVGFNLWIWDEVTSCLGASYGVSIGVDTVKAFKFAVEATDNFIYYS
ncbi:hypothetical protein MUP79_09970, partial [Candidatus Bathyarchaeota archaeon]|nr:hypothetical protein [Candidatus Bathyarchaeota archaeon]